MVLAALRTKSISRHVKLTIWWFIATRLHKLNCSQRNTRGSLDLGKGRREDFESVYCDLVGAMESRCQIWGCQQSSHFEGVVTRPICGGPSELTGRVMGSSWSSQSSPMKKTAVAFKDGESYSTDSVMSTTYVEACGTSLRATRGSLDLGKSGREGFDDEDSCEWDQLRWFGQEGRLKCTTSLLWWVTIFHGLMWFRHLKPSQM